MLRVTGIALASLLILSAWKTILSEDQRWDVINYVRSLGSGDHMGMGGPGMGMNAATEEAMRADALARTQSRLDR